MIVNRDYEKSLNATLALKSDYRIYEVSKEDGEQRVVFDSTTSLPVDLEPGDAILLRVQPSSEEAFVCEYKLVED